MNINTTITNQMVNAWKHLPKELVCEVQSYLEPPPFMDELKLVLCALNRAFVLKCDFVGNQYVGCRYEWDNKKIYRLCEENKFINRFVSKQILDNQGFHDLDIYDKSFKHLKNSIPYERLSRICNMRIRYYFKINQAIDDGVMRCPWWDSHILLIKMFSTGQLRKQCRTNHIKGYTRMNKTQLINALIKL